MSPVFTTVSLTSLTRASSLFHGWKSPNYRNSNSSINSNLKSLPSAITDSNLSLITSITSFMPLPKLKLFILRHTYLNATSDQLLNLPNRLLLLDSQHLCNQTQLQLHMLCHLFFEFNSITENHSTPALILYTFLNHDHHRENHSLDSSLFCSRAHVNLHAISAFSSVHQDRSTESDSYPSAQLKHHSITEHHCHLFSVAITITSIDNNLFSPAISVNFQRQ